MAATESVAGTPLRLPCGLVLKNRLVKAAMSEKMAIDCLPAASHERVYKTWAQGGWATLITGNIMVDDRYLGGPGDVAVSGTGLSDLQRWSAWTRATQGHDCHMIAQLNHPGRQSPAEAGNRSFFSKTLAPSAVPLNIGTNWIAKLARALIFGTPRAMSQRDIDEVTAKFVAAAKLALQSGFQGVEVHAGHGFLLCQFMTSSGNERQDEFGGSAENRVELVLRIIRAIRAEVPSSFCVGVKINTADFKDATAFSDMLRQIELIHREQVDYVNLSGGSFEDPKMMSTSHSGSADASPHAQGSSRDAFFLRASKEIRHRFPDLVLVLTGGFRSRTAVNAAIESGACSAVGIGRPAVKYPDLPNKIMFNKERLVNQPDRFDVEAAPSPGWIGTKIRSVGAGAESKYWASLLQRLEPSAIPSKIRCGV